MYRPLAFPSPVNFPIAPELTTTPAEQTTTAEDDETIPSSPGLPGTNTATTSTQSATAPTPTIEEFERLDIGPLTGTQTKSGSVGANPRTDLYRLSVNTFSDFYMSLGGNASATLFEDANNNGQLDKSEQDFGGSDLLAVNGDSPENFTSGTLDAGNYLVNVTSNRSSGQSTQSNTQSTDYSLLLFTNPFSPSQVIADSNQLIGLAKLTSLAARGSTKGEFFDFTPNDDAIQISSLVFEGKYNDGIRGGVRALEGNDTVTGYATTDIVNGNSGADVLRGADGNDFLRGGQDNDQLFGDFGDDLLNGNKGNDFVDGGFGNDYIRGGQDNDVLTGGSGNDILVGDLGSDTLTGGSGGDIFVLKSDFQVGVDTNLPDQITDFSAGDRICIVGNISPADVIFNQAGANIQIQLGTGEILGVVLNVSPPNVQSGTFTVFGGDSAMSLG